MTANRAFAIPSWPARFNLNCTAASGRVAHAPQSRIQLRSQSEPAKAGAGAADTDDWARLESHCETTTTASQRAALYCGNDGTIKLATN